MDTQPSARTIIGKNVLIFIAYSVCLIALGFVSPISQYLMFAFTLLYLIIPVHFLVLFVKAIQVYRKDKPYEACLYLYSIFAMSATIVVLWIALGFIMSFLSPIIRGQ
jgi:hypothetical protein